MRHRGFRVALLCALATGCARPAQERAERDLEIGNATSSGLGVSVAGGLAAVRSLEAERAVLWSSAPAWELELESAGGAVRLVVADASERARAEHATRSRERVSEDRMRKDLVRDPREAHRQLSQAERHRTMEEQTTFPAVCAPNGPSAATAAPHFDTNVALALSSRTTSIAVRATT